MYSTDPLATELVMPAGDVNQSDIVHVDTTSANIIVEQPVKQHKHKNKKRHKRKKKMALVETPSMIMGTGATGDGGLGLGGGLIGGVLLGALLGRNGGLFGGGTGEANGLQSSIDTNVILQSLGDIKASVPLAESQVQLALAGVNQDITSQSLQQTIALQSQGFNGQLANLAGFASTKDAVDSLSTQVAVGQGVTNTNIERLGWSISQAISNDGEKTRALVSSIDRENLNRMLTTAQNEIIELRGDRRRDDDRHAIEINMINNQNQNQMQFQQQNQILNSLAGALVEVGQIARATNSNVIVGNTGATTTGTQTANPTNVRA